MPRDLCYGQVVERHSWARWVWVIWAFLATATLALSTAILTTMITVHQNQSYFGSLQSRVQEVDLLLSQGLPLKDVLVQNGDTVSAGQTLAVLDEDRLRIMLDELEKSILADNILRQCLQSGDVPSQEVLEAGGLNADTQLKLARAINECQSFHDRHEVQIQRIFQAERYLKEERNRRIRHLKLAAQGVEDAEIQTRIAVQIAIELSNNVLKVAQVELELSALRADHKQELVATLKSLENAVVKGRLRKVVLEQAQSSPRLYAARSGRISDLREVQAGREYLQEILLLKIIDVETIEYVPSFSIPRTEVATLHIGDRVSISVLGSQGSTLQLKGAISKMKDTVDVGNAQPLVRIDVQLDEPSLAQIKAPSQSKFIEGRNSRSEIRLSLPETELSDFLIRATHDLVRPEARM